MEKMEFEEFEKSYQISEEMLQSLVKIGEKNKVSFDEKDFKKSKNYLKLLLKAQIGRNLYGDNAYYKIINEINSIYLQALKLFNEADKLDLAKQ
jgi:carboxyl-terminal processing protease